MLLDLKILYHTALAFDSPISTFETQARRPLSSVASVRSTDGSTGSGAVNKKPDVRRIHARTGLLPKPKRSRNLRIKVYNVFHVIIRASENPGFQKVHRHQASTTGWLQGSHTQNQLPAIYEASHESVCLCRSAHAYSREFSRSEGASQNRLI